MSRIIVSGKYGKDEQGRITYALTTEDGTLYQKIVEGEPFRVSNQMRTFTPVRTKNGMLVCEKYGDGGDVIEDFFLHPNKKGFWATSAGSARNGVFHWYREVTDPVEKLAREKECSDVSYVDSLEGVQVEIGGSYCRHCINKYGTLLYSDGKVTEITEPPYVTNHSNQYHIGCLDGYYTVELSNASYYVTFNVHTYMNGVAVYPLNKVVMLKTISKEKKEEVIDIINAR